VFILPHTGYLLIGWFGCTEADPLLYHLATTMYMELKDMLPLCVQYLYEVVFFQDVNDSLS
jgi:hypothetical protein